MKKLLAILSFIPLVALPVASPQSIENATIEREEYAVYSAMIADYAYEEKGTMVIANPTFTRSETINLKDLQFFSIGLKVVQIASASPTPPLLQATLDDFLRRNHTNRWLNPRFEMNSKYVLVDFRDIKKLVSDFSPMDQEWKAFFKEYPESHGFVTLSRVGFNRQMDQALVHAGWSCPGLCGHWSFLMLAKKDGAWKVVGEANRVVS